MYHIVIQQKVSKENIPSKFLLRKWVKETLATQIAAAEITINIIGIEEMTALNHQFRKLKKPTNVLSFPFEMPDEFPLELPILGDIAICAAVVNSEIQQQQLDFDMHWAHMVVHGCCHLLGYDHQIDREAIEMEQLEINVLKKLGFKNPYDHGEIKKHHE